jgi:hypothetical protein
LSGCATVFGWVTLGASYTGPFVLSNVSNITGGIHIEAASGVTSIVINDLTYVGEVSLSNLKSLTSISFLDTSSLSSINIVDLPIVETIDFPSLLEADYITIAGNGTKYNSFHF